MVKVLASLVGGAGTGLVILGAVALQESPSPSASEAVSTAAFGLGLSGVFRRKLLDMRRSALENTLQQPDRSREEWTRSGQAAISNAMFNLTRRFE